MPAEGQSRNTGSGVQSARTSARRPALLAPLRSGWLRSSVASGRQPSTLTSSSSAWYGNLILQGECALEQHCSDPPVFSRSALLPPPPCL